MKSKRFRKSIRLPDYDYSQAGAYFVTLVTQNRKNMFGYVIRGEMVLNEAGQMVDQICREIPEFIPGIRLDYYQIMPDHLHMIIEIECVDDAGATDVGATLCGCPGQMQPRRVASTNRISLPNIVARFKSLTTRRYIDGVHQHNWIRFENRLWQRNYYERIIRDEREHQRIVKYIQANPLNWGK